MPLTFTISSEEINVSSYMPTFTLDELEFDGWYYIENGYRVKVYSIDPAEDYGNKRLFAQWKQISGETEGETN